MFSNSTAGQPIYSLSKKLLCYQNIPLLYTVQCTVTLLCIKNSETNWRGLPIAFKLLLKIAPNSVFLTHSMYLRGTPYTCEPEPPVRWSARYYSTWSNFPIFSSPHILWPERLQKWYKYWTKYLEKFPSFATRNATLLVHLKSVVQQQSCILTPPTLSFCIPQCECINGLMPPYTVEK